MSGQLYFSDDYRPPDLGTLTQRAVALLQREADRAPLLGAFSGGKDSCVIKRLAELAGVTVSWRYHETTIDPPELVRFIREHHPDVIWDHPRKGFFARMAEKRNVPTRAIRWCCQEFKERKTERGAHVVLGVRIAESPGRRKRFTHCTMEEPGKRLVVLPIRLWRDEDVWEFIRWQKLPYCSLYDEGFARLGCVGCPLTGPAQRAKEFARWPGFERAWRAGFRHCWRARAGTRQRDGREWFGSAFFANSDALFDWWNAGQRSITGYLSAHPESARRERGDEHAMRRAGGCRC